MSSKHRDICVAIKALLIADVNFKGKVYVGWEGSPRGRTDYPCFVVTPGEQPQARSQNAGEKTYFPQIEIYIYVLENSKEADITSNAKGDEGILEYAERIEKLLEENTLGGIIADLRVKNQTPGPFFIEGTTERGLGIRIDCEAEYWTDIS